MRQPSSVSPWRIYGRMGGRPQGEIRVDIAAALIDGPGTTRELAIRTGWSIGLTRQALQDMVRAGDACKLEPVRCPGVKRPVPVYGRAMRLQDAIQGHGRETAALGSVLAGWARWPTYVEAAM